MVDSGNTAGPHSASTPSVAALRSCARFLREFQTDLGLQRPRDEVLETDELTALEDHLFEVIASLPATVPEYKMLISFGASLGFIKFIGMADDKANRIAYTPVGFVTCGRVANSGGKIAAKLEDLAKAYAGTDLGEMPARIRSSVTSVRLTSWRP